MQPEYPQNFDEERQAIDAAANAIRTTLELGSRGMRWYLEHQPHPVKVEVSAPQQAEQSPSPVRQEISQAQQHLHAGVPPEQVQENIRNSQYLKSKNLNSKQQDKYAAVLFRKAQIQYAMDVAKPTPKATRSVRRTL